MSSFNLEQDTSDDMEEINYMPPSPLQDLPFVSMTPPQVLPSTSSNILSETLPMPPPPLHAHNSTIARAYWFVNNKKVSHNVELKIYNVQDEHEKVYQVELLPKAKCTCVATFKCAHILAVQHINGFPINENYRHNLKLSELTKKK